MSPPLFCSCWIRDPRSEIQDPVWKKIRIRDPGLTSRIRNTIPMFAFISESLARSTYFSQLRASRVADLL
jgi:hypothetical protein